MLPVIALVGRPNVGKSTLFNRLTRTRDALVADFPGLTRDRKYGQADYDGYEFIVVDTGGIDGSEQGIETEMAEQSLLAIEEADIVLFLVDARAGMTAADQAIANHLRKQQKKCFVVANKVDGIDADSYCAEFFQLSLGDIHHIAAAHGRGITQLLETTLQPVIAEMAAQNDDVEESDDELIDLYSEDDDSEENQQAFADKPVKLAIIGRPNVGKSTLTNRILGEERVIVYDMPGTTRDSIYIPMTRNDKEYILIDTAGVRKRKKVSDVVEKFSVIKTLQAIEDANVVLLVVDAREGISDQDLSLLGFALNAGRSLVVAVNKWDGLDDYVKERIKSELDRRLGFIDFARLHFISALHGTGVGHLFESVDEAYESATKRISTAMLRRIMDMAQADHQPPLVRGRRVKLKYAHAGGYNPPRIVIHGNQVHDLPDSYKRYLMNYYRKALNIMGTPIKIEFREGDNPYAGRTNKVTLSQKRKIRAFAKENRNKS
ncbi:MULTISPECIES: ribosome biogenesis GTPase Der [Pseudoalteromonas]|jgi:GTP-binding protein|uniref:GTPase Der n=1 Tax=Pseudoalteromonas lipolytica TaxID=570156 RepID=A0AAD0S3I0_9GAMM|nr:MULTISPECIES: ribosome biogenesis GTPase Der [Pseudoalteromonas]AXV67412.1 ribosome biogenesis GTPase Der [Pseudoalteromonas donghaensis]EWH05447.1 GTP-binding protein Der [Pseudoalteromonas lipolytica SCSIO 04301]MBE0352770.1 GTP-binding protein [Pseudoalteromonas lipolytica LMEB 39]MCC9660321.1 ribosome biogenesis GTPase Der [Pseudoalteromonas sp. MB41]QLJ10175.1 ribosome biogenesis GTPase Der [Pseudoalteromonas sp. JSTW]|tara:strand:+ start:1667 stop:3136 length:1470 start_codon:yes stop_codon:yes gene_type:complete